MKERFAAMDANNDKSIDLEEFLKAPRGGSGAAAVVEALPAAGRPEAGGCQ